MKAAIEYVFDASALIALLRAERGAGKVEASVRSSCISAVNLAEVYSKMIEHGKPHRATAAHIAMLRLPVIPFDGEQAARVAGLWQETRAAGLSLGDRACLGLAMHLGVPAVTAEREWAKCKLPVGIVQIR